MKQVALLFCRKRFYDVREALTTLQISHVATPDRIVAPEHRALRSESVDAGHHGFAQRLEASILTISAEIRQLDRDVLTPAHESQSLLPARDTFGIAIDRRAAMVDHEHLILELVREPRDILRLE